MSFRTRLTWFFIVIVIVPMIAVAVVLFRLVADSEQGKSDARLSQAQTSASAVFRDAQQRAGEAGRQIAEARALAQAIESGDEEEISRQLEVLRNRTRAVRALLTLEDTGSFDSGRDDAVAGARTTLLTPEGGRAGELSVAVLTADAYARQVNSYTGLEVVVLGPDGTLASTLPDIDGRTLPGRGETEVGGQTYRLTTFTGPAFEGEDERIAVRLLADERDTQADVTEDSLVVAALLIAFLVLAFAFALTVSRSLQAQIQRLLVAAKRLGSGQFAIEVPTEGNDEFAALGSEFNAMARQLESRLEELQTERARLQNAIRRVGESFAKGLDRDALLEIMVQTAVDGVAADAGRASARGTHDELIERARTGDLRFFEQVMRAAEAAVLDAGEPAETTLGEASALAHPLRPSDGGDTVLGVICVARSSPPFSAAEKELFNYLASQAGVSIENVDLHEAVQRQAVTDELTGLFNHRRFQEVMSAEVERARRFGSSLGLIMFDIDNFKQVNDTFGHLQGDLVLRRVAEVLRESSREIDEPARYGGEEMAVALPQTDLEGAYQFAERVRQRIEELEVPVLDGDGVVRITASFGAAALPESSDADKAALVAAADAALYRAKRLGKNRTERAG